MSLRHSRTQLYNNKKEQLPPHEKTLYAWKPLTGRMSYNQPFQDHPLYLNS